MKIAILGVIAGLVLVVSASGIAHGSHPAATMQPNATTLCGAC